VFADVSSFGARLREQRERQQVTLAAIAEQTKIRLPLLEGLERDDVSHWPGGIFRRSYLRAYAAAIGLDPDETTREFLELFPDPVETSAEALAAALADANNQRRPRTRLRYLIESAIGALPQSLFHQASTVGAASPLGPAAPRPAVTLEMPPETLPTDEAGSAAADSSRGVTPSAINDRPVLAIDLAGMARLCTELTLVRTSGDVERLITEAAPILHAVGIILWLWDPNGGVLRSALSYGYPDAVLAQLPVVSPDADNAIGAAFRSALTRVVEGAASATGAIVVPLVTPGGCTGVLAVELYGGAERHEGVRALATILAAQLSSLIHEPPLTRAAATA
jgi:transcriptional regulator with XRE-family HTH domain